MNYKELKAYIEMLEASDVINVTVDRKWLLSIAKEALVYRKKNAMFAKTKHMKPKK